MQNLYVYIVSSCLTLSSRRRPNLEIAMVKFTILLRRHPSMSQDAFVEYHRHDHARLFCALPAVREHVRRTVQSHALPLPMPGLPDAGFDGITEIWTDDVAGLDAVFSSDEYRATIRPDEARFLDLHACAFLLSSEAVVIG